MNGGDGSMKRNDFLEAFYSGNLGRTRTCGQYSVYDKNLLNGDKFSCHILMRDPVKVEEAEEESCCLFS